MRFRDAMKANQVGYKAYRTQVSAMQLRKTGKYTECEEKLEEAIKLYEQAYDMGYRKTAALQGYALLLMRRGEFERARQIMLECDKDKEMSKEDRLSLRIDYSICQWRMGRLDKAIETVRTAAQTTMNGTIYTTLGMFLVEKARETGDFQEALQFNQEAVDYDAEDPGVLDNIGQLSRRMADKSREEGYAEPAAEQHAKAREYLKKAYDIKPDQISSTYYYALTLHEDGQDDVARSIVKDTLKIPFSAIIQVSKEEVEALEKELG